MTRRWGAAAFAGLAVGALALASPAQAHHNAVDADVAVDGCTLTATTSWTKAEHQVDSTVLVVLAGGEVSTAPVGDPLELDLPPGTTSVQWRIWGGGERDYDDPALTDLAALVAHLEGGGSELDPDAPGVAWHTLDVTGCAPPTTPPAPPSPAPPADLDCADFGTQADAQAVYDADPSDPHGLDADDDGVACETLPDGSAEDEEDTGGAGELPVTGISAGLIGLGAVVLLAAGGGLYLVARKRRVSFTA